MTLACKTCGEVKAMTDFYFRKDTNRYRPVCKSCWDAKTKKWAQQNKSARSEHRKRWEEKHPGDVLLRKKAYRERHPIEYRRWNLNNPDKVREINRLYAEKNRHIFAAKAAFRRAMKKMATPPWADQNKIADIYRKARILGLEVDHIIPLSSPVVCGLHVETNLQLLPMNDNRKKSNKFMPEEHGFAA